MKAIHGGDIYRNQVKIDFSVNINPLGMPPGLSQHLIQGMDSCQRYPDIEALALKQAISEKYGVSPEHILLGNGASELFMGIVHALKPGKILLPVPSFYGYEYAAQAAGSEIYPVLLREEREFDPGCELLLALQEDMDLLFLANPNNPTGRLLDKKYLKKVLDVCREKEIIVVLDECFVEFCTEEYSLLPELEQYSNLLIVRAFTKLYGIPGIRLGYLFGADQNLVNKVKSQLPEWNISCLAQEAGVYCMGQDGYVEHTRRLLKEERTFLIKKLMQMGIRVYPGAADFLLLYSEIPLYEPLLKRGILIRSCENFKGLSKGYYRIAIRQRQENEILVKAMEDCLHGN